MTIVLVHGNPETAAIWDDLVPHLRTDDIVRLSPPGFGSAIPSGFDCSTSMLIATGLPTNSTNCHNRSILWAMTGAAGTSWGSQWSVRA